MANRGLTLPIITSEDISRDPDQTAYKLNMMREALVRESDDREAGDGGGSEALAAERQARIDADSNLGNRIDQVSADSLRLILSTTDIGEGAPLAENTLYGVYSE